MDSTSVDLSFLHQGTPEWIVFCVVVCENHEIIFDPDFLCDAYLHLSTIVSSRFHQLQSSRLPKKKVAKFEFILSTTRGPAAAAPALGFGSGLHPPSPPPPPNMAWKPTMSQCHRGVGSEGADSSDPKNAHSAPGYRIPGYNSGLETAHRVGVGP